MKKIIVRPLLGREAGTFFQPKLSINQPNDVYEQEADAMADKVMNTTNSSVNNNSFFNPSITSVQRKCAHCEQEEKQMQRKENNSNKITASNKTEAYINSLSGGRSLNKKERSFFEPRMGYDFSNVKIHTDAAAAQSAQAVDALAYTTGNNIVFNHDQFKPDTDSGKKLLSHELTHVVQQTKDNIGNKISRYSHDSSCKEDDLKSIVWPGDYAAKLLTNNALKILRLAPSDPKLKPLYSKYFMTPTPDVSKIIGVFDSVKAAFDNDNYQYECVNKDCDYNGEVTTLPLIGGIGDIRLCVEKLSGKSDLCVGRTILHEFTHYYRNTDDNGYCKTGCGYGSCPSTLTTDKAVDNADSFACFAYELYSLNITASSPPAASPSSAESSNSDGPVDAGLPGGV